MLGLLAGNGAVVAVRLTRNDDDHTPAALRPAVKELESYVERTRGLRFLRNVDVSLKSDADFNAALRGQSRSGGQNGPADTRAFVGFLRALGLVDAGFDPSTLRQGAEADVLGFYDPETHRLLVRGSDPTPAVKRVLVHELTHALDDQHFDLNRPALERQSDESNLAFHALGEGDARWVEQRWVDSRPPDEKRQTDLTPAGGGQEQEIPQALLALVAFPYLAGRNFVQAISDLRGRPEIDRAFGVPPTTTEQILHPARYLAGEGPKPVAPPEADGKVIDQGVLGELYLRLILLETLDLDAARKAADGWGGDRVVVWAQGAQTCIRDNVVMDTPTDKAELLSALRRWAVRHPGASIGTGDPVVITRCA